MFSFLVFVFVAFFVLSFLRKDPLQETIKLIVGAVATFSSLYNSKDGNVELGWVLAVAAAIAVLSHIYVFVKSTMDINKNLSGNSE